MAEQKWPQVLWIVRHGQSAGNVARDAAEAASEPLIDIAIRDVDTPLSELGRRQAVALGRWFGTMPRASKPNVVLCSPYVRAVQTTELLLDAAGVDADAITHQRDERLREKEFGLLDRLTKVGIRQKYPELAEQRAHVGKFYFRPPDTLTREYRREQVLIVAHQVIVNCLRYLFERMSEEQILTIDRVADVPNCSVTSYEFDPNAGRAGKLVLRLVNFVAPLEEAGAPVTAAPDTPGAPKP